MTGNPAPLLPLLLLAMAALCAHAQTLPDFEGEPLVQTANGPVRGALLTTEEGRTVAAFKGIPYAKPPVGKNRFKDPKPAKPWAGVWDATNFQAECLNFNRFPISQIYGDEDCLYLNVFTPRLDGPPLDVVVYVHGGGFMYGSGSIFGAEILLDRDLVLVHFDHRLGPLGYLSTEDEVVPGNVGMKDMVLVLRWVKDNIAHFGGNPNSVTIMGLSAGGASVHYLAMSPLTKGLFHRAWAMSGSNLNPWTRQEAALEKAKKLGDLLGCPTATSRELIDCLRRRPARAIVSQVLSFQDEYELPFSPFAPVVEPSGLVSPFLDREPIDIMRAGQVHDVPFIWSYTSEEGLYPIAEFLGAKAAADGRMKELAKNWLKLAPTVLDYNLTAATPAERDAVSIAVKKHYLGDKPIGHSTEKELIKMASDRLFNAGIEVAVREMAAVHKQPMYLYEFAFRGKNSLSSYMAQGDMSNWGVSHADDTMYLYKWDAIPTGVDAKEKAVRNQLLSVLTSFMKTGTPSLLPGSPTWKPVQPRKTGDLNLLRFTASGEPVMTTVPDLGSTKFWSSQPLRENLPAASGEDSTRDEL